MTTEVLNQLLAQSVWAVLFVWLVLDLRKRSTEREDALQSMLEEDRKQSAARELSLMDFIRTFSCALQDNTTAISKLSGSLNTLFQDVDAIRKEKEQGKGRRDP